MPKEFGKYLDAYIWLKGDPEFGTHVLNPVGGTVPGDIFVSDDISASELETDYSILKDNRKWQKVGQDKAK